jgi:AraC-like DNA-binding protein
MTMPDVPGFMYRRFTPSPQLIAYVEHYWLVSAPGEKQARREILIPNGRPMLLMSFAKPSIRIDPLTGDHLSNGNTLSEITSQPFVIEQFGESKYIGVQFRPYGLSGFLVGKRIVNRMIPLAQWLGEAQATKLIHHLHSLEFGQARVKALDTYLQTRLVPVEPSALQMLESIINRIEKADDHLKVDELAQEFAMSYAMFYRMFKNHVGIGPKRFLDIVRYFTFVGSLLNNANNDPNALIASLQGYYDQAHASKEFKRFTGVTPNSFRRTLNSIARLMHQG